MAVAIGLWITLLCLTPSHAYTTFSSDCSIPPASVNYVSSPNTRGSLNIIWSCFGVIVACVYSILHLNIPRRAEHVDFGKGFEARKEFVLKWRRSGMPIMCALYALVAPEMIFALAAAEFFSARAELKLLQRDVPSTKSNWNLAHMFFADMGGYCVLYKERKKASVNPGKVDDAIRSSSEKSTKVSEAAKAVPAAGETVGLLASQDDSNGDQDQDAKHPSMAHSAPVAAHTDCGGASLLSNMQPTDTKVVELTPAVDSQKSPSTPIVTADEISSKNSQALQEPWSNQTMDHEYLRFHLNASVYRAAMISGLLPTTAIPMDELEDRSKSDWFAKALVIFQLVSFFITIIARAVERLPVSPLEISVCAFAVCSVVAYAFLFAKPKNAFTPVVVARCHYLPEEICDLKTRYLNGDYSLDQKSKTTHAVSSRAQLNARFPGRPPDLLSMPGNSDLLDSNLVWMTGLLFAMVFGGIHVAGWSLEYPSVADQWIWRITSLVTLAVPPVWLAIALPFMRANTDGKAGRAKMIPLFLRIPGVAMVWVLQIAYVLARLALIVETIRTLFFLPPKTYLTPSWSLSIPHVG